MRNFKFLVLVMALVSTTFMQASNATTDPEKKIDVFKASYVIEGDIVQLKVTNPDELETTLTIVDVNGRQLNSTIKKKKAYITHNLDFSQVPAGDYKLVLRIGSDTYTKTITIS